ncbi:MAG: exosortase family protein XrtF [Flavobacterium stagni]
MTSYFKQYRPFLFFLLRFALTYVVLAYCYGLYLEQFSVERKEVDGITQWVAEQSKSVLQLVDSEAYIVPNPKEAGVKLFFHHRWIARIVEGCNAISVMILFVSFVIAFKGKFKAMVWFLPFGIAVIHIANIIRIALLAVALYHFPKAEHLLHGVLFPLLIYGIVFILWMIWVNRFSEYAKGTTQK